MGEVICLDGGLFAEPPRQPRPAVPRDPRTRAQRRRDRQRAAIDLGQHPLAVALGRSIPLHPQASRGGVHPTAPTCGGCVFRRAINGGNKSFPKCTAHPVPRERVDPYGKTWRWQEHPRATHGDGTDVAAWFPACIDYQPIPTTTEEDTR